MTGKVESLKLSPFVLSWLLLLTAISTFIGVNVLLDYEVVTQRTALIVMIAVFVAVSIGNARNRCPVCGQLVVRRRVVIFGKGFNYYGPPFKPVCSHCHHSLW
jgi:hypothetical protein